MDHLPKRKNATIALKSNIVSLQGPSILPLHQFEVKFTPNVEDKKRGSALGLLENHILK